MRLTCGVGVSAARREGGERELGLPVSWVAHGNWACEGKRAKRGNKDGGLLSDLGRKKREGRLGCFRRKREKGRV
jgi:hypothetical protein